MNNPSILLYSNRANEIDEYSKLLVEAELPVEIKICRSAEEVEINIAEVEIIFGVHLPPQLYQTAHRLKWIQSMWAGVEGLMNAPIPEHVLITKPWGVFGHYLSSYVFANLLAQKIKVFEAKSAQDQREWQPYRIEHLHGQCMGIAGLGDVASETARVAKAFGMKVIALNRSGQQHSLADQTYSANEREAFVADSDVLVLAMPSTSETRGMFDRNLLGRMRPHAWIINIGRGALIDDAALIDLLEQHRIGGAILDVFQNEPLPSDHPYWRLPNCIVTPHIGGPSLPSDISHCFIENFKRYQSGEPLLGLIDRKRGY
jgi:glyoxylate/hydroxypyruvate reductase A